MAQRWKVISQRETTAMVAGSYVDAMLVTFETDTGETGSVTVPYANYNPDSVRDLINARYDQLASIRTLTPEP